MLHFPERFRFRWSPAKSEELALRRGVSFEALFAGEILAVEVHPTRPHQKILLVLLDDYIWVVPFVPDDDGIFLKTAYPSRKYTKLWRKGALP